jgi:Fe-S cluster biosynthesis and repair protein YggX
MDGASESVNDILSTSLLRSQWNPALNIPCTTGVRMPNFTDCTRYYMCNSTSGTILSYACPPHTAFNVYKHVCETSVYNWCKQQTMIFNQLIMLQPLEETTAATTINPSLCSKAGKIPDPHSRQHYFVCYIESDKILSYRMACPNKLEYCESEKVCKKQNDCSK